MTMTPMLGNEKANIHQCLIEILKQVNSALYHGYGDVLDTDVINIGSVMGHLENGSNIESLERQIYEIIVTLK